MCGSPAAGRHASPDGGFSFKMTAMPYSLRYPRKQLTRHGLRALARLLLPLLADVRIAGRENFPRGGPLIVVGNHTAAMEVVLMTVYCPWLVEFMGSTDIPHDRLMARVIGLYGFIPVFRGNVSPSSMQAGIDVLRQGGVLGVFPEGGIWEPAIRRAQPGVAWLSHHAQAPVLPIGFGSMQGALKKLFTLKRPTLKMNVGRVLPPVQLPPGAQRKEALQQAADRIMDAVWGLIPAEDRQQESAIHAETFALRVAARDRDGAPVPIPTALQPQRGPAFSKFTHRRTLIQNFIVNLRMPEVAPLTRLADDPGADEIASAAGAVLAHLERENPYYFTYRYGQAEGSDMAAGVREVHALAVWARDRGLILTLRPIRRFIVTATGEEVELDRPAEFDKW